MEYLAHWWTREYELAILEPILRLMPDSDDTRNQDIPLPRKHFLGMAVWMEVKVVELIQNNVNEPTSEAILARLIATRTYVLLSDEQVRELNDRQRRWLVAREIVSFFVLNVGRLRSTNRQRVN